MECDKPHDNNDGDTDNNEENMPQQIGRTVREAQEDFTNDVGLGPVPKGSE